MIIFLYGPDTFRSHRKLEELKAKFIKEVDKSALNIEILDGVDLEPAEFEKAVSTPPFLAKKRLVIIKNLITKNKGQKIQKEILTTLEKPNLTDTIIIFWEGEVGTPTKSRSKTAGQRSQSLLNRLKQEKYAQEFNLLTESELQRFIQAETKNQGIKIESPAIRLLANLVGNDLWQLNNEIQKLSAFAKNQPITTTQIAELVKTKIDENIFNLTDALGQKNKSLALKLVADQLANGMMPTELLSKITWQFKNLLLVKDFVQENGQGYPPSRLTYQLGLHPFVIKKTMSQVSQHQLPTLKKIYRQLLKIDRQIKTSQINPEVLFDLLIVKD
ncbi:MAG: DNA polymerase III subunit delta [Patescibacteria group bacterium]|jgi:DNA polymerase-3 subunit delta|nr:DNA polymerase III subunit delta [Patescibacteria group bacterium]